MQQIRLENWDWIVDDDRPTSKAKGASRRYAFNDFTNRIKLNERPKKKGPNPKVRNKKQKGKTHVWVGSIMESVCLNGIISWSEVIKRFPSAKSYNYEYSK